MMTGLGASEAGKEPGPAKVWTIGHWTCSAGDVLATLEPADIGVLVDVRKLTGSRRSPQFDADEMSSWLQAAGIDYVHLSELGGRRPKQNDIDPALNAGWQNASFKNYADYALTPQFEKGFQLLTEMAVERRVVLMCGEPMPWRCHRLLISNTLAARGWDVVHLMNDAKPIQHRLGRWGARPTVAGGGAVTYPGNEETADEREVRDR